MGKTYVPTETVVSSKAALDYEEKRKTMVEKVDLIMIGLNEKENLIGENPISVMKVNHSNHADFMTNVFKINDYKMLNDTLFWVLGSYESRGFTSEYFPKVIDAWIEVISETLEEKESDEIKTVYLHIKTALKEIEKDTLQKKDVGEYPFDDEWAKRKNRFTEILLEGNSIKAINYSRAIVKDIQSLKEFHVKVVTYALYEVGKLWEKGAISVAQEHLATSVVMRIMSLLYLDLANLDHVKGTAIVTSAANEYHEVGARIVADMLEVNGWDVIYLGANTPIEDVIKTGKENKPDFIALSVTMTFNLDNAIKLIQGIRKEKILDGTKIIVGGYVFKYGQLSKEKLGADAIETDIGKMLEKVEEWRNAKS